MNILAPISAGELIDKITILAIKSERLTDQAKRANVLSELAALQDTATENLTPSPELERLTAALKAVNEGLWDVEEGKRDHERRKDFGDTFIALARRVYVDNDQRAAIKKEINLLVGSKIVEEKSYQVY
jgi:predicted glycosyltransferase